MNTGFYVLTTSFAFWETAGLDPSLPTVHGDGACSIRLALQSIRDAEKEKGPT